MARSTGKHPVSRTMPSGGSRRIGYMYGLPPARLPSPFVNSLFQAYAQHYQSYIAFQHQAMVMSQVIQKMTRGRSSDPSVYPFYGALPFHFNLPPTDDLRLPPTFPELDECSPLYMKSQSDQGYFSSDTRSKSSRLSTGSETSGQSRFGQVSPDSVRCKPSRPSSLFDDNSQLPFEHVSSSVVRPEAIPVGLLEEDSRSVSKYLPAFCEDSNQGLGECDIEIKIEPLDSPSRSPSPRARMDEDTHITGDIKQEVLSPVKCLNSDVMWSVEPEKTDSPRIFVPSPDKSSNECSTDFYSSYFSHPSRQSYLSPLIIPFTPSDVKSTTIKIKEEPSTPPSNVLSSDVTTVAPRSMLSSKVTTVAPRSILSSKVTTVAPRSILSSKEPIVAPRSILSSDVTTVASRSMLSSKVTTMAPRSILSSEEPIVAPRSILLSEKPIIPTRSIIPSVEPTVAPRNLTSSEKAPDLVQTVAIDLSMAKKRKARTPMKENMKKRQKKDIALTIESKIQLKAEKNTPEPSDHVDEQQIWKRDPRHDKPVLQPSPKDNKQDKKDKKTKQDKVEQQKPVNRTKPNKAKSKNFPCTVCKKCYSQRSSLHTHMRIHTGVRPYECKDCGRTFTDCSTYIKHCRLHTGEKPYACGVCGRCFTQSGNMMRHQDKCKAKF